MTAMHTIAMTRARTLLMRLAFAGLFIGLLVSAQAYLLAAIYAGVVAVTQTFDHLLFARYRRDTSADCQTRPRATLEALSVLVVSASYSGVGYFIWAAYGVPGHVFALFVAAGGLLHTLVAYHASPRLCAAACAGHILVLLSYPFTAIALGVMSPGAFFMETVGVLAYIAHIGAAYQAYARSTRDLAESEHRLQSAVETARLASWEWSADTDTVRFSAQLREILGYEAKPRVNTRAESLSVIHPDDRDQVEHALLECFAGLTKEVRLDCRIAGATGAYHDVVVNARGRDFGSHGAPSTVAATLMDVTDQRRRENRLTAALEVGRALVWEFDLREGKFRWEGDCEEIVGFKMDAARVERESLMTFVRDDHRERCQAVWDARLRDDKPFCLDHPVETDDGSERWVRSWAHIEKGHDGRPVRAHGLVIDITDQKNVEAALESARDAAEHASRAKSEFLAVMSHEIRTPMNGVLGMAAALERTELDPHQRKMISVVRDAGDSLMRVLNDVLDVSKIDAGQLVLDESEFSFADIGRRLSSLHAPSARAKGLEFSVTCDLAHPDRLGDDHRIMQIMHNLVSNAIKFTDTGAVRVAFQDGAENEVVATIADTGIGMTSAQQVRVFEPFAQAESSTTRRFGGSGLGLAIVRRLSTAMDGRVTVSSKLGAGSTFTFTFAPPLAETAAASDDDEPDALSATPGQMATLRVLAAEDNAMNQTVLEAMLAPTGVQLSFAENGQDAVDAVLAQEFDLVLMDIQMPVMDGIEARATIAERMGEARPYIVALTANAMAEHVAQYRAAGFDDFLAKPIDPAALMGLIVARASAAQVQPGENSSSAA